MMLTNASCEAILKSEVKDEFYKNTIHRHTDGLCKSNCGDDMWIKWHNELHVITDLIYYWQTTINGLQTLGEEYASIIQVDDTRTKIPSLRQQYLHMFLQILAPYGLKKIPDGKKVSDNFQGLSLQERKHLAVVIDFAKGFIPLFQKFQMMIFYLEGTYINISKRLTGIKYVLTRALTKSEKDVKLFKKLSLLIGLQLIAQTYSAGKEFFMKQDEIIREESTSSISCYGVSRLERTQQTHTLKCVLCLDFIRHLSVTPCGHLFCWQCIVECTNIKNECPSCREKYKPSRIVYLQHYDPP